MGTGLCPGFVRDTLPTCERFFGYFPATDNLASFSRTIKWDIAWQNLSCQTFIQGKPHKPRVGSVADQTEVDLHVWRGWENGHVHTLLHFDQSLPLIIHPHPHLVLHPLACHPTSGDLILWIYVMELIFLLVISQGRTMCQMNFFIKFEYIWNSSDIFNFDQIDSEYVAPWRWIVLGLSKVSICLDQNIFVQHERPRQDYVPFVTATTI